MFQDPETMFQNPGTMFQDPPDPVPNLAPNLDTRYAGYALRNDTPIRAGTDTRYADTRYGYALRATPIRSTEPLSSQEACTHMFSMPGPRFLNPIDLPT